MLGGVMGAGIGSIGNELFKEMQVGSDIDDLIDWLEIDCDESEFEQNLLVLDSMTRHSTRIKKYADNFCTILSKLKISCGYERGEHEIRKVVYRFGGVEFPEVVSIPAGKLLELLAIKRKKERDRYLNLLGVGMDFVQDLGLDRRKVRVNLVELLKRKGGVKFLEEFGVENICFSGVYTLCEVREKIDQLVCLHN